MCLIIISDFEKKLWNYKFNTISFGFFIMQSKPSNSQKKKKNGHFVLKTESQFN